MAEGGGRARAKLQSISTNGGLLQLQQELSAGDFVEIAFHTRAGDIHGMAEMLPPTRKFQSACLQPFRFVALDDDDHRKLRMALDSALDREFLDAMSDHCRPQPTCEAGLRSKVAGLRKPRLILFFLKNLAVF
ncbi:MAG: hypothetical protein WCF68_15340 [Terriglobales bacterium]